ncbi:MAG: RNA polymerase subunit sigma-70 [Archangium gephyra]|uniref:RNA polymerase subunit sigma-70 n=1 Tax=Archangium gephyra TaxID=48 RepID=A0A2W5THM2_9BACT|nr:MAG: RNA polymerase subunit sigma-70 [Archangium gephyra]
MLLDPPRQKVHGAAPLIPSDDSELVARAAGGEPTAFEALVERHRGRIYGLALRMLNSEDDAAEVLQETFISAYRNLANFRGDAQFGSWVLRIAANHALMRLRHRKVVGQVESPLDEPTFNERGSLMDEVADVGNVEEQAINHELRDAIEAAASKLGDDYREVFVLRDLEGMSYEEIAELTGITVPAVKSRLHRARLSLRSAIDHFYQDRA